MDVESVKKVEWDITPSMIEMLSCYYININTLNYNREDYR
jgi:hypothetical protein